MIAEKVVAQKRLLCRSQAVRMSLLGDEVYDIAT